MYDQQTDNPNPKETTDRSERKADAVGHIDGQCYPVYLRVGYGGQLYVGAMGQGSGQRRNLQNDFTSLQYPNWRHDWIPVWYQAHAE